MKLEKQYREGVFSVVEEIDDQYFELQAHIDYYNEEEESTYWYISMVCYDKNLSHAEIIELFDTNAITGKNPFKTIAVALEAYELLEDAISFEKGHHIIEVFGSDEKRRRVYEKYLMRKKGFYKKDGCLFKEFDGEEF